MKTFLEKIKEKNNLNLIQECFILILLQIKSTFGITRYRLPNLNGRSETPAYF